MQRLVYASTIWVYGNAPGPEPHDEDTPLVLPPHLYTATKLAGEMYCRSYDVLYGLPTTILRFGIPYGPRARPAAVVPAFIAKAQAGTPLTIAGDGSATRQFVYVEDLAEGVVAALAPEAAGRIYNLVGDELVSVRRDRRHRAGARRGRSGRARPGPAGRSRLRTRRQRAGGERARLARAHELRGRCPPLRRLAHGHERLARSPRAASSTAGSAALV